MATPIMNHYSVFKVLTYQGGNEIGLSVTERLGAIKGINPESHVLLVELKCFLFNICT